MVHSASEQFLGNNQLQFEICAIKTFLSSTVQYFWSWLIFILASLKLALLPVIGHRKICVPPAVICEHRLRASCEPKKVFCGHLRAEQFTCVQLDVRDVGICVHLRAFSYLPRYFISYLRVPEYMLNVWRNEVIPLGYLGSSLPELKFHGYFSNLFYILVALHCTFLNHSQSSLYDQNWRRYAPSSNRVSGLNLLTSKIIIISLIFYIFR